MAIERSKRGTPKLSKEVLPPQKPNNGIGVMLVAATAMFFAVASSAFILRARMASERCPAHQSVSATTMSITPPELDQLVVPVPPRSAAQAAGVWTVPFPPLPPNAAVITPTPHVAPTPRVAPPPPNATVTPSVAPLSPHESVERGVAKARSRLP